MSNTKETAVGKRMLVWQGCYSQGWEKGDVTDETFSHPAKYSKQLIFRIIQHLIRSGYIQKGNMVLDCFAGVGLGALPCMTYGLHFLGVELEPRFHTLAQQNLALWQRKYGLTGATVLCGDSRQLRQVLSGAGGLDAVCSSPPYIESLHLNESPDKDAARVQRKGILHTGPATSGNAKYNLGNQGYGTTEGQLATLPPGPAPDTRAAAVVAEAVFKKAIDKTTGVEYNSSQEEEDYASNKQDAGLQPEASRSVPRNMGGKGQQHSIPLRSKKLIHRTNSTNVLSRLQHHLSCNEVSRNPEENQRQAGISSSSVQGWEIEQALPLSDCQESVLPVWEHREISDPSQERRSLRSSNRESGSPVPSLPHEPHQESLVGCEESRENSSQGQRPCRVDKEVSAVVSSPPFLGVTGNNSSNPKFYEHPTQKSSHRYPDTITTGIDSYGVTQGQMGNASHDTFWSAASAIMAEVYALLKPQGVAVWVLKDYISKGQRVPFCDQWRALCEWHGFTLVEEIHASLVEDHGTQGSFLRQEGPAHEPDTSQPLDPLGYLVDESTYVVETSFATLTTKRRSFFRALYEKKHPENAIDHEVVLIMRKGAGPAGEVACCVSSPPYAGNEKSDYLLSEDGKTRKRDVGRGYKQGHGCFRGSETYGQTNGQLGSLPTGTVDAILSSPPYAEAIQNGRSGIDKTKGVDPRRADSLAVRRIEQLAEGYGTTPGQLGSMKPGTAPTSPEPSPCSATERTMP